MNDPILLHVDGFTDIGNRRQNNEDAWWAGRPGGEHRYMNAGHAPLRLDPHAGPVLLLISDGVGGASAGEVASRMGVTIIADTLAHSAAALADANSAGEVIRAAVNAAHTAVLAKATEPGCDGMGATLSLLCFIGGGRACWAQAGDSRIYLCRGGRLRQVSRDHSPVGRMCQRGEITEAEARRHPLRHQIDLSLGDTLNPFEPDGGVEGVQPGDVFLLCSDGLSDGLWDREIEETLATVRAPEQVRPAVRRLVGGANDASGRDNITAVIALVESMLPEAAAKTEPSFWRRFFAGDFFRRAAPKA